MNRRKFCNLLAASAAATVTGRIRASGNVELPPRFDQLTETYAEYCATPANKRTFYALNHGKVVPEKLNNKTWKPTLFWDSPTLPIPDGSWRGVPMDSPIHGLAGEGPYKATWNSLLQWNCPEWFRDAKFGIWNHWSVACVPELSAGKAGWYGHYMYIQGSHVYNYHLEHYGPPSRFGFKDFCPQWTLLNWDPGHMMDLYQKAGAKFFFALAGHHDGFDTWDSKHHPWNAVNMGPHRDVVGTYAKEARKRGMRFGVTSHQAFNWWWFQASHGADKTGPLAGVPYDGNMTGPQGTYQWWQGYDPQVLYGPKHPHNALPDISYVKNYYDRIRDLVDQHNPDLLLFDGRLFPLGWAGLSLAAYFYNRSLKIYGGKMEGVLAVGYDGTGTLPSNWRKAVVRVDERGISDHICPYPWLSEICVGNWFYGRSFFDKPGKYGGYMTPRDIISWLSQVVSKNGTLVLNIPGKPDGTIDQKEQLILEELGKWFSVNAEAIYATRPWKISSQGNICFTRNKANTVVYTIFLKWPDSFEVPAFGTAATTNPGKITNVQMLGLDEKLTWEQRSTGLNVRPPKSRPNSPDYAVVLKVMLT